MPAKGKFSRKAARNSLSGSARLGRKREETVALQTFDFIVEKDADTGLYVGYVPGWPGAHTQGADLNEVRRNLREVIQMLLEDGEPELESKFVGVRRLRVAGA
jgi:predicted RNase H-like HicB family nuclease